MSKNPWYEIIKSRSIIDSPSFQLLIAIFFAIFSVALDYFGYSIFSWPIDGAVVALFVYRTNWPRLMLKVDVPFKRKTLSLLALSYFVFGTSFSSFVKMLSCPLWLFRIYFFYQIFSFLFPILFAYLVKNVEMQHLRKERLDEMIFIKGESSILLLSLLMGLGEDFVSLIILGFALFQAAISVKRVSFRGYIDRAGILVESYERSFWQNLAKGEKYFEGRFHVAFLTLGFLFFFSLSMFDVTSISQVITMILLAWIFIVMYLIVKNRWSLRRSKPLLVLPVATIFFLVTLEGSLKTLPIAAFYSRMFFTTYTYLYGETLFGMSFVVLLLVGTIWPLKPKKAERKSLVTTISRLGVFRQFAKKTLILFIFVFFSLCYFVALMFVLPEIPNAHLRTAITILFSGFYVWLCLYKEVVPIP